MARSIVHLTTFLQGGAGRAITDLACRQHDAGHTVLVITSMTGVAGYGNYPEYLDRLQQQGVKLLEQDSLFTRDAVLQRQVLDRLRILYHPDSVNILHAHAAIPARVALTFARDATGVGPAIIQTQHGWGSSKTAEQSQHDLGVLSEIDRTIVTSTATRDFLVASGVPARQIAIIPCGISARIPQPPPDAVERVAPLRAPGRVLVGCVGSVTENKNQSLLVRALALDATRQLHAVFIGEGGDTLRPLASELGVSDRVHLFGYQAAAEGWIGLFDVLAVPSRSEGQGLVVLEAFRAGVPVVASDIPALRELVVDRNTGWLFQSDDARSLRSTIVRAISLPQQIRDRIVDAAARKFLDGYTVEGMTARHDALYEETMRRRNR